MTRVNAREMTHAEVAGRESAGLSAQADVAPVRWAPVQLAVKPPRRCSHGEAHAALCAGMSRGGDSTGPDEREGARPDGPRAGHGQGDAAALAQAGRPGRGPAQRWPDDRRTGGPAPAA